MENSRNYNVVNCQWLASGNNTNDELSKNGFHSKNSFRLCYIIDGNGTVAVDDIEFRLSKGQSFLVFPFSTVKIQADIKRPWSYKWVEFSGVEASYLVHQTAFKKKNPVVGAINVPEFHKLFDIGERDISPLYAKYRTGCQIMLLLSYYIENFPSKPHEQHNYAHAARSYIEQNYHRHDFCVKQVADYVKIDRTYLYRLFKEETGLSVIDYINSRRISRAQTMLVNKDIPIKDVADSVGFSDQMYFSRVFKKLKGITPTEFRKNSKTINFY